MWNRRVASLILGLLTLLAAGCGGKDPNLPELVPVGGTVIMDGKALSGTSVSFVPDGSTRGSGANGYTDQNGKYELSSPHLGPGAPAGDYRVVLRKLVMPDGSDFPADSEVAPMDSPARQVLPARYSDDNRTELTATVPEGGGTIDFPLQMGSGR